MKKILASVLCATLMLSVTACGGSTDSTENVQKSAEYDIDPAKQVTKLVDYSAVEVTIDSRYEKTDEHKNAYLTSLLNNNGADAYKKVADRKKVKKGDYVKVDYTGYKDGEAFEGGAAQDVLLDVDNNCTAGTTQGFIEGFTAGLVGAKVGEKTSYECTFPEEYQSADLAGQTVTFEFDVKGIYSSDPVTFADLKDEDVEKAFSETLGMKTVEDLENAIDYQLDQTQYGAVVDAVKEYMIENCEYKIPDGYLDSRVKEYEESFAKDNVQGTETLESFLTSNYNMSVEDAEKTWADSLEPQIQSELIFGLIADKEDIKLDEKEFKDYVDYIISSSSSGFSTEDDVYTYFGAGDAEYGKTYLENQYRVNKAIDLVVKTAVVNYSDSSDKNESK